MAHCLRGQGSNLDGRFFSWWNDVESCGRCGMTGMMFPKKSWRCLFFPFLFQVDIMTFNMSLSSMSRVSRWIQALTLLSLNRSLQFNVITLGAVMTTCARALAWLSCLHLLNATYSLSLAANEIVMNSLMASVGEEWRRAIAVFFSASKLCQVDVISYNTTMRSAQWWRSVALMLNMMARGLRGNVVSLNTLVSLCPWQRSLKLLTDAEEEQVDTVTYNSCINACPRWLQVLALIHRLSLRRLEATVVTSTSTMTVLEKSGMWQFLMNSWDVSSDAGATAVLNAGVNGLGQNGEWMKSLSMVKQFVQSGLLTDVITWGSIIVACEIMERWQRALTLSKDFQMHHSKVVENEVIFNAACCAFAQGEQWQKALELLDHAALSQMQLNILAYNSILSACSKAARWQESLQILASLEPCDVPMAGMAAMASIKTYNTVLSACRWHWREALHLWSELPKRGLVADAISFDVLMDALEGRCLEQASLLLRFAEGDVHRIVKSGT